MIVLDERVGDTAVLSKADDGELYFVIHPSAAEDDSPARSNGHTMFRKAVEVAMNIQQDNDTTDTAH
jgi:hypothetical protein